jgi:hypothetical protein
MRRERRGCECGEAGWLATGWEKPNIPGSTADFRQRELYAPDLTLIAETVFADGLEFGVTVGRENGRSTGTKHSSDVWQPLDGKSRPSAQWPP